MSDMFMDAHDFNQAIGSWNVSHVQYTYGMFMGACKFNQDIGSWDVCQATVMVDMLNGAHDFNQDIRNWDTSNVIYMAFMFEEARAFCFSLSAWDVSDVEVDFRMLPNNFPDMFLPVSFARYNQGYTPSGHPNKKAVATPSNPRTTLFLEEAAWFEICQPQEKQGTFLQKRYLMDLEPRCIRWIQITKEKASELPFFSMEFGHKYMEGDITIVEFHEDYIDKSRPGTYPAKKKQSVRDSSKLPPLEVDPVVR
ncbi:fibronectin domain containing protein [Nitzschia inconspicua]|uniref:Fibronectin domain containing protein n=1 Tax=Nitzschia inconspicua TaxID=303405 RepID=A0A9K3PAL7_9STRA|nr:fibronectin domain containing protein [Nitzschia inconspicua]